MQILFIHKIPQDIKEIAELHNEISPMIQKL